MTFAIDKISFTAKDLPKEVIKNPFLGTSFNKQLIVVDFWATWCAPCLQSFEFYQEVLNKYEGKIVWLAINEDSSFDEVKLALKNNKETFHFYFDSDSKLAKKFNIVGIPHLFALDSKGNILFEQKGFTKKEKPEILAKFETALKKINF